MTAVINSGEADVPAGIAAAEKIASDGNTKIPVYRGGIFKVVASGSVTVGAALSIGGVTVNEIAMAPVNVENLIGTALETATDGQTFLMELNPRSVNLA